MYLEGGRLEFIAAHKPMKSVGSFKGFLIRQVRKCGPHQLVHVAHHGYVKPGRTGLYGIEEHGNMHLKMQNSVLYSLNSLDLLHGPQP